MPHSEESVWELLEQMDSHKAALAQQEWSALGRVYKAYQRNAAELLLVVTDPQRHPELAHQLIDQRQHNNARDNYFDEIFRHLLNYLAAVKTLVDHSRILTDRYRRTAFKREYEQRKDELAALDVAAFLHRFRNYLLHCKFPSLAINWHVTQDLEEQTFTVTLDRDGLLEWDSWNKGAKAYIARKDSLVVSEAVEEYDASVSQMYRWLFAQFTLLHRKDLDELRVIRNRARELLDWDDSTNRPRRIPK